MAPKLALTLALLVAVSAIAPLVAAHETRSAGKYDLRIGFADEPPLVGTKNAVNVFVFENVSGNPVPDLQGLKVTLTTGPASKEFDLAASDEVPGQYSAAVLPTAPGIYTAKVTGKIQNVTVDLTVDLQKVDLPNEIAFPAPPSDPAALAQKVTELNAKLNDVQSKIDKVRAAPGIELPLALLACLLVGLVVARRRAS